MLRDFRVSLRVWMRSPVLALAVILTFALAVGAGGAVMGVLRAVLLSPLPYPDADRLAIIWTDDPAHAVHQEGTSYPNFADWSAMNRSFTSMGFFIRTTFSQTTLGGADRPERVQAALTSANLLEVTGVNPLKGRTFREDEVRLKTPVALVSTGVAERRFGTVDAVGRTLDIDGALHTVIGIMPRDFRFPTGDTDVWLPYTRAIAYQDARREGDALCVVARLRPNISLATARSDMADVGRRLAAAHPNMPSDFAGFGVNIVPIYEHVYGSAMRLVLQLLAAAALAILIIAVANIANLLLARMEGRGREFSIRAALGATTPRLARQMAVETATLALAGSFLGLAAAYAGLRVSVCIFSTSVPRLEFATVDWRIAALMILLALAASLAASLPALCQIRRGDFVSTTRHRGSQRMKRGLAISQIALATAVLASSGFLLRSYLAANHSDLGYRTDHLLVFELATTNRTGRVAHDSMERIRALPGVRDVAAAGEVFLQRNPDWQIYLEGRGLLPDTGALADDLATPNYFSVMGVPLLRGRVFTPEESLDAKRPVVIINQAMAERYWHGEDPIGRRFATGDPAKGAKWRTVIGVVGNMQVRGRESTPIPEMYWAVADYPTPKIVVRTAGDPLSLIHTVSREIAAIDPGAVAYKPQTVDQRVDLWMQPRRLSTAIASTLAGLATLLAAIGIFSLLHYSTAVRTQEMGVRLALGSTSAGVMRLVLGDAVQVAAPGILLGAVAAAVAAKLFSTLLFDVRPWDQLTLGSTALTLLALAIIASLLPAWRASRIEAASVLRRD